MGRCKHVVSMDSIKHACRVVAAGHRTPSGGTGCMTWKTCAKCGAWLPLGPANDAGCEVEIDAAARAAEYRDQNARPGYDRFEWCPTTNTDELCDVCHTMELVSRIFEHKEES